MTLNIEILAGLIDGSPYPIYLILGDELSIALANEATLKAWGKDSSVIGKRFSEALPELEGQPFEGLLRKVMSTGEPYYAVNDQATLLIDGKPKVSYFTFSYQPLVDVDGSNVGVVCYATDVTGLVESTEKIELLADQARQANQGLALINKELEASNEQLATTNEELTESYHSLELSELRFKNLIQQAPISICVIRALDLVVTDVNDRYLELVGKERGQLDGLSIWQGVPEAAEGYAPVLQEVIKSKRPFFANEAEILLVRKGKSETVYVDFIYEPVIDLHGNVSSIMVVVTDVSQQVNSRRAIEEVEERIRLAVDAADIGTYEYRFDSDTFIASDRVNDIIGLGHRFSREELKKHYHPEDVQLSDLALEKSKESEKVSYEARLIREGEPMKWLKFQAKVYFNSLGIQERSLGTLIDITEFKTLQQQKDDFISIASHELKTPITSLKASLQLLTKMKENLNPVIFPKLLDHAARSMSNISELVDDLLNVTKMNEGQVALKKNWFKVSDMLKTCCDHVRDSLKHKLVLELDVDLLVFADERRVEQVVINLINNAIKYAPDSPRIVLGVKSEGEMVVISVTDNGSGIPPEKIPHLFDRYFRVDTSGKYMSGLGLGLYISADIVKRHGGQIGVESKLGVGSTFWFTLPSI
jgi:PAS domain S-box-containing protein